MGFCWWLFGEILNIHFTIIESGCFFRKVPAFNQFGPEHVFHQVGNCELLVPG